jgi:hypothetical protein
VHVKTRLAWALARLPVSLILAGVRRTQVLPVAPGERPARFPSPGMIALGMRALERAAGAGGRRLQDPDGRWRELSNKVQAFAQFRRAAEADDAGGVFADLWRREGRGYLLGRAAAGGPEEVDRKIARRDLLPCHTGLGLGLATHHIDGLRSTTPVARLARAVDRFLADSRRLSLPGYQGAVVEALGLTIRLSHPRLLLCVDEELAARSERIRALYWHGVGRGIYFDFQEMAPLAGGRWRALEHALQIPPSEETKRNAVAGVAWATTLVNFCTPRIIAARLRDPLLGEAGDAAANGVASVTLLWLDAVGDGPLLREFRRYRVAADPGGLWDSQILAAVELAIEQVYPLLVEPCRIDELFRWRAVDGWPESLRDSAGSGAERSTGVPAHG